MLLVTVCAQQIFEEKFMQIARYLFYVIFEKIIKCTKHQDVIKLVQTKQCM